MKFIDVHSHVQFAVYDADREEVIKRARDAQTEMINVGTQADTSKAAVAARNAGRGLWGHCLRGAVPLRPG